MQVVTEFDARIEMKAFVDRARARYSEWYVGVAADPDERLRKHGLQENDWYIVRQLGSGEAAQRVAEFVLKLGCDGCAIPTVIPSDDGGAEQDEEREATAVYAYWKRGHTEP